jgi:hypothetical protein
MIRFFCVAIFWLLGASVAGAQAKFMAYRITGKATYSLQKKQHSLKIGKTIPETATIHVPEGSSVMLICEQASKPVTLTRGDHKLISYRDHCNAADESITSNYLKYVWWQMTNPGSSPGDEKNRNGSTSGAVSRGCPGVDFLVPDTLNYYKADIVLQWKVFSPESRAEFVLYEDDNSPVPVLILPMKNEFLHLDSLKKFIKPGTPFYWNINLDGNQVCDRRLVQVWEQDNFSEMTESLRSHLVNGVDEAEQNYQMGFLLEQDGFLGEAYQYYKAAAKMKPGDDRYKRTEKRFKLLFLEED